VKTDRNAFPWPLFVVIACVGLATGYSLGHAARQPETQFLDWNGSHAQAEDAYRRWAKKADETPASVRRLWSPRLMAFPTKNCIELWPDGVGGVPIYCYRANSLDLLEEYSDSE
jgi:hypothetical protein